MRLESQRRWKEKQLQEGLCIFCSSVAVSGYKRCYKHLSLKQKAEYKAKLKNKGLTEE